jgi:hypothetical protein
MTLGSSMLEITFTLPAHSGQVSMSMLNTRPSLWAQVILEACWLAVRVLSSGDSLFFGFGTTSFRYLKFGARHIVLGHLQRSHPPTTTDRFLTSAMGIIAARLADQGQWGKAAAFIKGQVTPVPIENVMGEPRNVEPHHRWVKLAQSLGIFI